MGHGGLIAYAEMNPDYTRALTRRRAAAGACRTEEPTRRLIGEKR